jgi:hypothetical protein
MTHDHEQICYDFGTIGITGYLNVASHLCVPHLQTNSVDCSWVSCIPKAPAGPIFRIAVPIQIDITGSSEVLVKFYHTPRRHISKVSDPRSADQRNLTSRSIDTFHKDISKSVMSAWCQETSPLIWPKCIDTSKICSKYKLQISPDVMHRGKVRVFSSVQHELNVIWSSNFAVVCNIKCYRNLPSIWRHVERLTGMASQSLVSPTHDPPITEHTNRSSLIPEFS